MLLFVPLAQEIIKKIGEAGFNEASNMALYPAVGCVVLRAATAIRQDGFDMEEFKAQVYKAHADFTRNHNISEPDVVLECCRT